MNSRFQVSSPSRLHFGLFAFGDQWERKYGGVGAMVSAPRVDLSVEPAPAFSVSGEAAERVHAFATRWAKYYERDLPPISIEVDNLPPQHSGLGVGTQLALCAAAACQLHIGLKGVTAADWAKSVGRAERSAIGTYGFLQGGLIAERGRVSADRISPLDVRCELPESWRFLLIRRHGEGLSGSEESRAFHELSSVTETTRNRLVQIAHDGLLPAAAQANWEDFSESLYEYGRLAGTCFSAVQGGPYNGQAVTDVIEFVRSIGLPGVGQSSWGPTVYALASSNEVAMCKMAEVADRFSDAEILIAAPDNSGVRILVNQSNPKSVRC
jgi:beta-ribofuranosylaminobenzene 5'-phosphate synthase